MHLQYLTPMVWLRAHINVITTTRFAQNDTMGTLCGPIMHVAILSTAFWTNVCPSLVTHKVVTFKVVKCKS